MQAKKNLMAPIILACATAIVVDSVNTEARAQGVDTASLCRASETTYLTCTTLNKKIMSICGNLPNTLQYRFGTAEKIELVYPSDPSKGTSAFLYGHEPDDYRDVSNITFKKGGYKYAVNDYRRTGQPRFVSIFVRHQSDNIYQINCTTNVHGDLDKVGKALPCDPDNVLNGANIPDNCHRPPTNVE